MKTPGTPLPWKLQRMCTSGDLFAGYNIVATPPGQYFTIAETPVFALPETQQQTNAAYIVEACNNFPALVHCLKEAYAELKFHNWHNTKAGGEIRTLLEDLEGAEYTT